MISIPLLFALFLQLFQTQTPVEIEIIGVYQGKSLFIQNPYEPSDGSFCVRSVYVNNQLQELNYNLSALKIDFERQDDFTPVTIRIVSKDSVCSPIIINPDAILFHTAFKFTEINLSDSSLTWQSEGEQIEGAYRIEKFGTGYWEEIDTQNAKGRFEVANYTHIPRLKEGGNKYRIKYNFGNGKYLFSDEVVFDFYPEPVALGSTKATQTLTFSRVADYRIFDQNSKMVLEGRGSSVDIRSLWPGDYVIYFNEKDPQSFTRERF